MVASPHQAPVYGLTAACLLTCSSIGSDNGIELIYWAIPKITDQKVDR